MERKILFVITLVASLQNSLKIPKKIVSVLKLAMLWRRQSRDIRKGNWSLADMPVIWLLRKRKNK